jgi:transcriptional repressor NrdR
MLWSSRVGGVAATRPFSRMKCPFCGFSETKVVDKRDSSDMDVTRRRRECLKCHERFTTYERPDVSEIVVLKKDGTKQTFDRSKLLRGIVRACEKRPIAVGLMEKLTDDIEAELRKDPSREISSSKIGRLVMKKLKKLDKVAYLRFASVYREFEDVDDFEKEVNRLVKKQIDS